MNYSIRTLFLSCCLLFFAACGGSDGAANKEANAGANKASTSSSTYESPMQKLGQILNECQLIQYQVYDLGISFESPPDPRQGMRFYSQLLDQAADETKCKPGKYDGGIVFYDKDGKMRLEVEFNLPQLSCNRFVFKLDGKRYALPMNDQGLAFFGQVLKMRAQ